MGTVKRFTPDIVQALARAADVVRGVPGEYYGCLQVCGDIGHGTRYIASHRELMWLGRGAARQAAAYYLGLIDAYRATAYLGLRGVGRVPGAAEYPEVRELLAEYWSADRRVRNAYGEGLDYANADRELNRSRVSFRKP